MRRSHLRSSRMWGNALLRLLVLFGLTQTALACRSGDNTDASTSAPVVTVYVSTDRVFAEPVLQEYQRRSGVMVSAVYDT